MYQGFPAISVVDAPHDEIDVQQLEKDQSGCLAFDLPPINLVQVDASVILRISKLGREHPRAFGHLLGMQIGNTVEVTNIMPSVQSKERDDTISDEEKAKMDEEMEAAFNSCYESAGFDTYSVGRYASCPHDQHFTGRTLSTVMHGFAKGHPCMLLAYDPLRTNMGKLYLKAYVPTDEYLNMHRAKLNATAQTQQSDFAAIMAHKVDVAGVLREVPVEISVSSLHKCFLHQLATEPRNVRDKVLARSNGLERYTGNSVRNIGDEVDKLRNDLQVRARLLQDEQNNGVHIPLKIETRTLMTQLQNQTSHLACVATTMGINADFAQKL